MNRKKNPFSSSIIPLICLILTSGCMDNTIEGLSSSSSGAFKVNKTSSSYVSINNCTLSGTSNLGTSFTVKIEYQGAEIISGISYTFRFSSGTTGGPTSANFQYYGSGGSSDFRAASSSVSAYGENYHCVRFGTSTSIDVTYTISTSSNKTYITTVTITKPVGAN